MNGKLLLFLKKPLCGKLKSIRKNFKRSVTKFVILLLRPLIRFLLSSKFGRAIFYNCYPPNSLLVSPTEKGTYIVNSSDAIIGLEIFQHRKPYDSSKLLEVLSLLPKNHKKEIIVDIGANIGTIGICAVVNQYFKRCIAFEPESNNFRLLKANIALNGVEDLFVAHNLALSDNSNEDLEFELCENNHGDHRVRVGNFSGEFNEERRNVIHVKSACLDTFSAEFIQDSTLIWIDTQGFEGRVFSGAKSVISKQIPIVMEFWPYGLKRSLSFDLLMDTFEDARYKTIIDLRNPREVMEFNRKNLFKIANSLGFGRSFTDLLIL